MTTKLFYDEPDLLEFTARVRSVEQRDGRAELVLDRTAFYPEGGGQPADTGSIAGIAVVHVRKEAGDVYHVMEHPAPENLVAGTEVACRVDQARRRDYRQQHTGQHILSAAFMRVGDYPTVSVHQGADYTTIEIDAPEIPPADLEAVERLANEAVESDYPITAQWVDDREIDRFPLRRPPKVSGTIRIVQIGDFDCVACGGLHLDRTGQVRLVRASSVETIRGHVRVAWKIGDRAIADYRLCSEIVSRLGSSLSAQPEEIPRRLEKQEEKIKALELEGRRLNRRLHSLMAGSLLADGETEHGQRIVTASFSDEPGDFLRGVTEELVEYTGVAVCLVNRTAERLQWSVGIAPGSSVSFGELRDELLPIINGKGGGKPPIWQGVGSDPKHASDFLAAFRRAGEAAIRGSAR
ncbi:MAG: alanyl-tRNA editing protein [Spirochaetota bacterium]